MSEFQSLSSPEGAGNEFYEVSVDISDDGSVAIPFISRGSRELNLRELKYKFYNSGSQSLSSPEGAGNILKITRIDLALWRRNPFHLPREQGTSFYDLHSLKD